MKWTEKISCHYCGRSADINKGDLPRNPDIGDMVELLPDWTFFNVSVPIKKGRYFFICGGPVCRELYEIYYSRIVTDLLETSELPAFCDS